MKKYVDFDTDIKEPYESILRGAYEKANIWGLSQPNERLTILSEEIEESENDMSAISSFSFYRISQSRDNSELTQQDVEDLKGLVLSTVCELLQVLAVCNKYWVGKEGENHE